MSRGQENHPLKSVQPKGTNGKWTISGRVLRSHSRWYSVRIKVPCPTPGDDRTSCTNRSSSLCVWVFGCVLSRSRYKTTLGSTTPLSLLLVSQTTLTPLSVTIVCGLSHSRTRLPSGPRYPRVSSHTNSTLPLNPWSLRKHLSFRKPEPHCKTT